ncbi:Uncharacterised protein [uncultured archaeon]|nr:Uncharacterised protein [uncultured archaeon]
MLDIFSTPSEVPGLLLRSLVALSFTGAAAYFDIFNKKWVPNYLVYGFLACALALNVIYFEQALFASALLAGIAVFAATYFLYRVGQLGGADVYVLASISLCVPYLPKPLLAMQQAVPYPFILSVLAPTGFAFILHTMARFLPYISKRLAQGKIAFSLAKIAGPALLMAAFLFFVYALASLPVALPIQYVAALSFLFASLFFFMLFKDEIKDSMVERIPVSRLQQEDVLALEKMDKSLVKRLGLAPLISAKTILLLKKAKVRYAPVYTGMPFFLPYLFLGLLFTLLFGDMLYYLVRL